jgi:acyl-coenzyme A thioesterase PaaI-like protein
MRSTTVLAATPEIPIGLKLDFSLRGDAVEARWTPTIPYEGYPGVIHGGIQATLLDEVAGWFIMAVAGVTGVTRELSLKYIRPARTEDGPFTITARETQADATSPGDSDRPARRRGMRVSAEITNAAGEVCTEAEGAFAVFSEKVSRDRFGFAGRGSLLEGN